MKRRHRCFTLAVLVAVITGVSFAMNNTIGFETRYLELLQNVGQVGDSIRLRQLFELSWKNRMADNPEWATSIGYPDYNDRWVDLSFDAIERRKNTSRMQLTILQSIDRDHLSQIDQLSYDLFKRNLQEDIEGDRFPRELLAINQMDGIQQDIPRVLAMMPTTSVADCENILTRLKTIPRVVDQTIALLDSGLHVGITPPRVTLTDIPQQVQNQIVEDPLSAAMLKVVASLSSDISEAEQERTREEAYRIYNDRIVPAFKKLHNYLVQTYIPRCRESTAWSDLPQGAEWYAFLVRRYTTTNLTPDEIFTMGQSEVKRIRREMDKLIAQTGIRGGFASFCEFLRTDNQFFFEKTEDLVREYRDIAKRADPELAKLFGRLPRLPYGVIPVPSYAEKSQTTAYYEPGSLEAGRPGYYYVNTYDLRSRPKWEMEALTLHEAVPGHHLQIALAQELEDLPDFRQHGWYTAYGEGWALYAEGLGEQMGFYQDPYSKFGQLTYEIWRAIRLVVDVGLHYKGWTRQQAIDYFRDNSAKTEHDINVEVDRYIVWPGQALAYKIGEMRIKELCANAKQELEDGFDIRVFHDEILRQGSLPLDVLETHIKDWIRSQAIN